MYVDCVLASLRIAQVDPGDEPLPEVVLSHRHRRSPLTHVGVALSLCQCLEGEPCSHFASSHLPSLGSAPSRPPLLTVAPAKVD
jgi:hypothetical protein